MATSYWERFRSARVSRRRAILGTGSLAASAAFLAACGGDDDDGGNGGSAGNGATPGDASGLLTQPVDQTSNRTQGGVFNIAAPGQVSGITLNWDQTTNSTSGGGGDLIPNVYTTLMRQRIGTYENPPQGETEPEFAQEFEYSGDGLSATFRLRGMKWDDRPPTSGRVSNSEDVKYSWERFEAANIRAPDLANSANPDAPILRVETPDEQTAVFRLDYPFAPLEAWMAATFGPFMYPSEADGDFDPRSFARGNGPWIVDDETSGGTVVFRRNPNYYDEDQPYFDEMHIHDIAEYSSIYSQFEAGRLDMYFRLGQEDVLLLKQDNPSLVMYQRPFFDKGCGGILFGRRPGSPFNDERVRIAFSRSIDRSLWGDTFANRERFEAEGLPVEVKWKSEAGPGYHWWLDPEENELGDASQNLIHDPAEVHKLMEAAGVELPVSTEWQVRESGTSSANEQNLALVSMVESTGDFQFESVVHTATEFFDRVRNVNGDFEGFAIAAYNDHHDFDWTMMLKYHPRSSDFWMPEEDPMLTDFVNRQRRELDPQSREQIWQEFCTYAVRTMNYVPFQPASWKPFYIGQPWLGGWGWWQPYIEQYPMGAGQLWTNYWSDESQR